MSLPQPRPWRPGGLPIPLDELFGQFRLKVFNSSGKPVKLLGETDGTLRVQSVLYHSGTTQIRQKAETDGTMVASLYGKDSAGNLDAFRTNDYEQQQTEPVEGASWELLGSSANLSAFPDLYTVPASTKTVVKRIIIVNRGNVPVQLSAAIRDLGAALANQHYVMRNFWADPTSVTVINGPLPMIATDVLSLDSTSSNVGARVYGVELVA